MAIHMQFSISPLVYNDWTTQNPRFLYFCFGLTEDFKV